MRCRRRRAFKLEPHAPLLAVVVDRLRGGWSPEQIRLPAQSSSSGLMTQAGACLTKPSTRLGMSCLAVSCAGIVALLRQGPTRSRLRGQGTDRRGRIPDMQSLHIRRPEVEDRLVLGHWEGDLIKGAANHSAVGTLAQVCHAKYYPPIIQ